MKAAHDIAQGNRPARGSLRLDDDEVYERLGRVIQARECFALEADVSSEFNRTTEALRQARATVGAAKGAF